MRDIWLDVRCLILPTRQSGHVSRHVNRQTLGMSSLPVSLASVAAIEGASGSGKTTLLRGLSARYGCVVIEIGVIVRAVAWWAQRKHVPVRDAVAELAALDNDGALALGASPQTAMAAMDLLLQGKALGDAAFAPQLEEGLVAATLSDDGMAWVHALVRERLRGRHAAISGREVATRTVPGARLVVRLEAEPRVRRRRKLEQMSKAGIPARWRDDARLLAAPGPDVLCFDTTFRSPAEILRQVGNAAENRLGWRSKANDLVVPTRHPADISHDGDDSARATASPSRFR